MHAYVEHLKSMGLEVSGTWDVKEVAPAVGLARPRRATLGAC